MLGSALPAAQALPAAAGDAAGCLDWPSGTATLAWTGRTATGIRPGWPAALPRMRVAHVRDALASGASAEVQPTADGDRDHGEPSRG
jgi:hypothetical protein